MHICVVTRSMDRGGAERVITRLLTEWNSDNVHCSLILTEHAERFYTLPREVEVYELEEYSGGNVKNKTKKYTELRQTVRAIRPDAVLAMPEDIGVYTILYLMFTGIPVFVSERNDPRMMPAQKLTRLLRRLLYPFARGFIFQTHTAAEYFPGYVQRKSIVLPNPLDSEKMPEPWAGEREKVVVSAGRFEPQKNFPLLVRSFAMFHIEHPDWKLRIYGDGPGKKDILDAAAKYGLPKDSLELPGVSHQLPEDMRKCSVFVLSSDYEGMPNAMIEAMAVGLPCIATSTPSGGPKELIVNNTNGFLVPVGSSGMIAEKLEYYAANPDAVIKHGTEGLKIKRRLDSRTIAAKWKNFMLKRSPAKDNIEL